MVTPTHPTVTTRSTTTSSESAWNPDICADIIERARRHGRASIRLSTSTETLVPSSGARLESGLAGGAIDIDESTIAVRFVREPWGMLRRLRSKLFHPINRHTRATADTSTTVSQIAALLRRHHRDKRIRRMSPENRAMYERIHKLREDIGTVSFDVVGAIREGRENG